MIEAVHTKTPLYLYEQRKGYHRHKTRLSKVNENENNASAGNRTRIYCLEGNNANLYTTNAELSGNLKSCRYRILTYSTLHVFYPIILPDGYSNSKRTSISVSLVKSG